MVSKSSQTIYSLQITLMTRVYATLIRQVLRGKVFSNCDPIATEAFKNPCIANFKTLLHIIVSLKDVQCILYNIQYTI